MTYAAILVLFVAALRVRLRAARKRSFSDHMQLGKPIPPQRFTQWVFGPGQTFLGIILIWGFSARGGAPIVFAVMIVASGFLMWTLQWINKGQGFICLDLSGLTLSNHWLRYSISLGMIDSIYTNDESLFIQVKNLDAVRATATLGNGEASPKALARFDRSVREREKRRGFPFQIETSMTFGLDPVVTKNAIENLMAGKA